MHWSGAERTAPLNAPSLTGSSRAFGGARTGLEGLGEVVGWIAVMDWGGRDSSTYCTTYSNGGWRSARVFFFMLLQRAQGG